MCQDNLYRKLLRRIFGRVEGGGGRGGLYNLERSRLGLEEFDVLGFG